MTARLAQPTILTPTEVAKMLRRPTSTLAQWRSKQQGPRSWRSHGRVYYALDDVLAWVAEQRHTGAHHDGR